MHDVMTSQTKTLEINPALWRRGQDWRYEDKDYIANRTGPGQYLAFGIVDEAFQTGFTMKTRGPSDAPPEPMDPSEPMDVEAETDEELPDGETSSPDKQKPIEMVHPRNDEIIQSDRYKDHLYVMKRAIGHARLFEWSVVFSMKTEGTPDKPSETVFAWGDTKNTNLYYEDDGVTENKIVFTPLKLNLGNLVHKKDSKGSYTFSTPEELAKCRVVRKRSMEFGQGLADIDPYLDTLFALACLYEMIGLWAIRTVGVPIFMADESLWDVEDTKSSGLKADIMDELLHYGVNSRFLFPKTIRGVETKFEVYSPTGTPAFNVALEALLSEISIGTGIPREKLLGNPTGMRASEVNQSNFWLALEKIQEANVQDFEWMYVQAWDVQGDFFLEINPFKVLDEFKQLELKNLQLDALGKAANVMDRYGITPKILFEWIGIDMVPDEKIIAEFQERRELLMNRTSQDQTSESTQQQPDGPENGPKGQDPILPTRH